MMYSGGNLQPACMYIIGWHFYSSSTSALEQFVTLTLMQLDSWIYVGCRKPPLPILYKVFIRFISNLSQITGTYKNVWISIQAYIRNISGPGNT